MYKLFKIVVKGKIWSIINDCHVDTESAIIVNQCKSSFFKVREGVRQGVLSGLLYLVLINDLLLNIKTCNENTVIFHINSLSTSPNGLQRMLNLSSDYSYKWCFRFYPQKPGVVQFSFNLILLD